MLFPGLITNYKYFEGANKSEHFYEISCAGSDEEIREEVCYYAHGEQGKPLPFGSEVILDKTSKIAKIGGFEFSFEGPFHKRLNIVNYQGFVLDCLDSDVGVYNLDNEIHLFGSACLDLPIGSSVTFFNLHLVYMRDFNWMLHLFGKNIKKSAHILVYCPAFSSYLEGCETVSYDNLIETKANFSSLIYTNEWLKSNFKIEFPGFTDLDEISSFLAKETSDKGAKFIGHCEKCSFSTNSFDFNDAGQMKQISTAKTVKESFHKIKNALQENSVCSNHVLSRANVLRNEVIYGILTRKKANLFDLTSTGKTIPIYCEDSNFNPENGSTIFIFNAYQIIELIPKLRVPNSWIAKAYLWISPETKVWSPNGFLRNLQMNFTCPSGFLLCKIVKKYLILKDFNHTQYETVVIHVESERGPHCFHLNPTEKYYGIINSLDSETTEALISIKHLIHESFFKEASESSPLPSSAIIPTLFCALAFDGEQTTMKKGPLQVLLNDLPYLAFIKGIQFFSIKLRTYSISTLSLKMLCSKCKSQIESGKCLGHFGDFTPAIVLSAVIESSDMNDTPCSILIDQFSLFAKIYGLDNSFKTKIVDSLKACGAVKLGPEHFSFKETFRTRTTENQSLEVSIATLIPHVSKVINCTFSINMANSILKPINLEICDPKTELMNILKLF